MESQVKEVKKCKKIRTNWSEASEAALLEMWPNKMEGLRGPRKNGHIYAEMAEELREQGYTLSQRDVQVKLQNFTQRYRKEKAMIGVSGGSPSTWPLYSVVHQIIGGFKANHFTELTIESIDECTNSSELPSPGIPSSAPTSPLSPEPTSSSSSNEPANKKRKTDFRETVLQKLDSMSMELVERMKKSEEFDREFVEIEKKKVAALQTIAEDNRELKNALISFLNK